MMRRSRIIAATLIAFAVGSASCSIGEDSAPRDIPVEDRGNFGGGAAGGAAAGTSRIYLITNSEGGDQPLLRSVPRDVPAQPEDVLDALLAGRNEAEQLETAIPTELEILGVRLRGQVLTVDVNDAFAGLDVNGVKFAVAQIVATATSIENVERVRLRINGEQQAWPTGSGVLTDETLSVYDYVSLIESSQPPFPAIPTVG